MSKRRRVVRSRYKTLIVKNGSGKVLLMYQGHRWELLVKQYAGQMRANQHLVTGSISSPRPDLRIIVVKQR